MIHDSSHKIIKVNNLQIYHRNQKSKLANSSVVSLMKEIAET